MAKELTVDGDYGLKNGWVLFLNNKGGTHRIEKIGVYTIWATRVVGG